ncbi:hypothetical protein ACJ41O_008675 [Fusarium nematophilum]
MTPKQDPTIDIDELYDALLITRRGRIRCFAYNVKAEDGKCRKKLDKQGTKQIKKLLSKVLNFEVDADTSEGKILKALGKLAKVLACPKHADKFTKDGDQISYIVSMFQERLEQWRDKRRETTDDESEEAADDESEEAADDESEEAADDESEGSVYDESEESVDDESEESVDDEAEESVDDESEETKPQPRRANQTPVKAKRRGRKRRDDDDDADTDDDSDDGREDASQDREVSSASSELAHRTRPKVTRKGAATNKEELVTPTKPQGSLTRNRRISFSGVNRGRGGDVPLSPLVDVESPASVFSPGPSEIFSPPLSQPTPDETPDSEYHRPPHRRRSQKRADDESPTRRAAARRKSALAAVDPKASRGSFSESDGDVANMSSEELLRREESHGEDSAVDDEPVECRLKTGKGKPGKEAEAQITGDDDTPSIPRPVSGKRNQPMVFERLSTTKQCRLATILDKMKEQLHPKGFSSGYIYCYGVDAAPDYLKIGYVKSKKIEDMGGSGHSSPTDANNKNVKRRLHEWKQTCSHEVNPQFTVFMECAVKTMESLIHLTLHEEKRKTPCTSDRCKRKYHQEWFKTTRDEALQIAKVWEQFSKQLPFGVHGELREPWYTYATQSRANYYDLTGVKEWLSGDWAKFFSQNTRERRREEIDESELWLVKERDGLAEERDGLEQAKSELEKQLKEKETQLTAIEEKKRGLGEQLKKMDEEVKDSLRKAQPWLFHDK